MASSSRRFFSTKHVLLTPSKFFSIFAMDRIRHVVSLALQDSTSLVPSGGTREGRTVHGGSSSEHAVRAVTKNPASMPEPSGWSSTLLGAPSGVGKNFFRTCPVGSFHDHGLLGSNSAQYFVRKRFRGVSQRNWAGYQGGIDGCWAPADRWLVGNFCSVTTIHAFFVASHEERSASISLYRRPSRPPDVAADPYLSAWTPPTPTRAPWWWRPMRRRRAGRCGGPTRVPFPCGTRRSVGSVGPPFQRFFCFFCWTPSSLEDRPPPPPTPLEDGSLA